MPVPVRGDPDPVAHCIVGVERLAARGVLQLHQAVVAVVGVARLVAAPVGAAGQIAEVVVAAVGAQALGIDRLGVVAVQIVDVGRDLFLRIRHINRLFRGIRPVQINDPRLQVAVDVVREARDIATGIDLLHQVLLRIVEKLRDPALGRGDRRDLVERRVSERGDVARVVGAGEHVAPRVVGVASGEQRFKRSFFQRSEILGQLAQAGRLIDVAQFRPQPPVIIAIAV